MEEHKFPKESQADKEATPDPFWEKGEAAFIQLRDIDNIDPEHIAFMAKMYDAFKARDKQAFANLVVNEFVRFEGSHHARYYDTSAVEEFLPYVAALENLRPTD